MTDSEKPPLTDLLSSFALGPAWARSDAGKNKERSTPRKSTHREHAGRRDDRGGRDDRRQDRRGNFKGQGGKFEDQRPQEASPADGVKVTLQPSIEAVRLILKEIQHVARVYPLFDVAKTILAERTRCHVVFERDAKLPPLWKGKHDLSLFLTREEAAQHLWSGELKNAFIEEETIEVDPPSGNFQLVAKCGLSGEWLGPPNFHTYQSNLRRIHRERFPNMPFASYSAKVKTERGEEAVNAWLESMKTKTRWRLKGGESDEPWIDDRAEAERALGNRCLDQAFETTHLAELPGSLDARWLSPSLRTSLRIAANHARQHPAMLIPSICKAIDSEHLPVFKRKGKLYTGPARPHPLPADATLAPRPAQMVEWIRANPPAKLEGLWKAVLPEGSTAPPAEYAADLFWLLHQGHILLFTDDLLVVQEIREASPSPEAGTPKKKKKKKKAKAAPATDGQNPTSAAATDPDALADSPDPADDGEVVAAEPVADTSADTPAGPAADADAPSPS